MSHHTDRSFRLYTFILRTSHPMQRTLKHIFPALAAALLLSHCGKDELKTATKEDAVTVSPDAFPGYTLIEKLNKTFTDLIDMEGRTVQRWQSKNNLAGGSYMLEDGSLLRSSKAEDSLFYRQMCPGRTGLVERISWGGELLWSFRYDAERYTLHHDIRMLPNGNVIMLVVEAIGREEQIANGRDPATLKGDDLWVDSIIEVKPAGKEGGEIVWKWRLWDHLIQDFDKTKKNYGVVADHPELIDVNFLEIHNPISRGNLNVLQSLGYVGGGNKPAAAAKPASGSNPAGPIAPADGTKPGAPAGTPPVGGEGIPDWTHANAVAYNANLDQIIISVRSLNEVWIIDHATTMAEAATNTGGKRGKGGALLYRWGNPQSYQLGSPADVALYGQHDAQWIEAGLPGAGSILLFNNGDNRKDGSYSSIDQIKPPLTTAGTYEMEEGQPFGPKEVEWSFMGNPKESFLSQFLSGAQRLPNGNTLICAGVDAYVFEVTDDGRKVWEWKYDEALELPGPSTGRQGPMAGGGKMRRPGMGGGKGPPGMVGGKQFRNRMQNQAGNPLPNPGQPQGGPIAPGETTPPAAPQTQIPLPDQQTAVQAGQAPQTIPAPPGAPPNRQLGGPPQSGSPPAGMAAGGPPMPPPWVMAQRRGGGGGPPGAAGGAGPQGVGGAGRPDIRQGAYRAVRYGVDHPAFKGKVLEPLANKPKAGGTVKGGTVKRS